MGLRSGIVLDVGVFVLAFFVGTAATLPLWARAQVAPHLTRAGLLRVRPGMSDAELIRNVGRPLMITSTGSEAPGATPKRSDSPEEQAWIYARPGVLDRFEVAVIIADRAVVSVNVEYDDATVYTTEGGHRAPQAPPLEQLLD